MALWRLFHGWMAFDFLDVNTGLTRSFTIGYRFTDDRTDAWTDRFNRFKSGNPAAVNAGVNLMRTAVPLLLGRLQLDPARTVFLPALGSGETVASENSDLSILAEVCAEAAGTRFLLDAITKNKHRPLHGVNSADRRHDILEQADYRSRRIITDNVFIFDDLITRGDTLSHIAQAIQRANQNIRVYGIGLGKTEKRGYHQSRGVDISNDHVQVRWENLWNQGEAQNV